MLINSCQTNYTNSIIKNENTKQFSFETLQQIIQYIPENIKLNDNTNDILYSNFITVVGGNINIPAKFYCELIFNKLVLRKKNKSKIKHNIIIAFVQSIQKNLTYKVGILFLMMAKPYLGRYRKIKYSFP